MKEFDYVTYWKDRHNNIDDIRSVGHRSAPISANILMYDKVKERYLNVLKRLKISNDAKFLDCGCGIGEFLNFLYQNEYKNLYGIDLSEKAITKIKEKYNSENFFSGNLTEIDSIFKGQKFDVVMSFDVLFHVIDDDDFEKVVQNMCQLSSKYIILHGMFPKRLPFLSCAHVKTRPYKDYLKILKKYKFKEIESVPTHIVTNRLLLGKLNKIFPKLLSKIDKFLFKLFYKRLNLKNIGSHQIKVFKLS